MVTVAAVNMLFFVSFLHIFMMVGWCVITPSDPLERPENWGMNESRFAEMMAIESTEWAKIIIGLKFYCQLALAPTLAIHLCSTN